MAQRYTAASRTSRPGVWRAPARTYWAPALRRPRRRAVFAPVAPVVDAGADATVVLGTQFNRIAGETDGGATITARAWTVESGPAEVGNTISTAAALAWTPGTLGTYVLRYTATNSAGSGFDEVTVTVVSPGGIPVPRLSRRLRTWLAR